MTSASARKSVESTLEIITNRAPAYAELTDKFGPVLLKQAALRDEFVKDALVGPAMDSAKLAAGAPVLADVDLAPWAKYFEKSARELLPLLAKTLGLEDSQQQALLDHFSDKDNIRGLAQARIEGNQKIFEATSQQLDALPPSVLLYISEYIFSPVLSAMTNALGKPLSKLHWEHGHCPVCGSLPTIAYLSKKDPTDLDNLVGGGGKKHLHCSLCSHNWHYRRDTCPSCGNDDQHKREVFFAEDAKHERIEACHKCNTYLLCVDFRECEPEPQLDTVQIGLIHLDMIARKRDLRPMTPTTWNSIE